VGSFFPVKMANADAHVSDYFSSLCQFVGYNFGPPPEKLFPPLWSVSTFLGSTLAFTLSL